VSGRKKRDQGIVSSRLQDGQRQSVEMKELGRRRRRPNPRVSGAEWIN
jgi:hypothetical protein